MGAQKNVLFFLPAPYCYCTEQCRSSSMSRALWCGSEANKFFGPNPASACLKVQQKGFAQSCIASLEQFGLNSAVAHEPHWPGKARIGSGADTLEHKNLIVSSDSP